MHAGRMGIQNRKNVLPGAKRLDPWQLWIRLRTTPGEVDDGPFVIVERDECGVASLALRRARESARGEDVLRAALPP